MTPEKQRLAIAEACKWKWAILWTGELHGKPIAEQGPFREVPDYLNDKNAMQEAKKVLWDKGLLLEFVNQLVGIVCAAKGFRWDKLTTDDHLIFVATATAEQEAEAFLRTLGLWEEAQ